MSLTWVEISKSALTDNVSAFKKLVGPAKIMAVVKSNAYGHGLDIVPEIIQAQVDWFGVSSAEEAIFLRDQGISKPILILSYYDEDKIEEVLRKNISLVVYESRQLELLNTAAIKLKTKAHIHLKIDTGMARLGVKADQAMTYVDQIKKLPGVEMEGLMSHFATGDEKPLATQNQLKVFLNVIETLRVHGIVPQLIHMAATASSVTIPKSHFNMVRLGIGLYGLTSYKIKSKANALKLSPALTFKTKVVSLRGLPKGAPIGYGLTYKMTAPGTIAILPVGYYEGYDRKLSNNAIVLVNGIRCPVRGRVSMNLMAIEVTKAGKVKLNDEAVLIGRQGNEQVTVDEIAASIKTINHEVITRLNPSVPRMVVN